MADSAKNSPYIAVKVTCPVCAKESTQRYVKSKFYQPVDIEKDHHVVTYKWVDEQFNHIRPENYYIWYCPHCLFADENDVFRGKIDPLWQGRLDFIGEKILKSAQNSIGFQTKIIAAINPDCELVVTEQAIITHLMACFIQETLLTQNNRLPHKASRFYLRLAWLYRERKTLGSDGSFVPGQYLSFDDFLVSLKELWPQMPACEEDALKAAAVYYTEMLNQGGKEDDIKKEVTLMFLLLDLNRRIGELDTAYGYVRNIFTQSMKRRQATKIVLDKGVHSGQLSSQLIEQMQGLITWLGGAIEDASAEGDAINEAIFWAEYDKACAAALSCTPVLPGKVVEVLRQQKFHEITCRKVANLCRPPKGSTAAVTALPPKAYLQERERQIREAKKLQAAAGEDVQAGSAPQ